MMKKVSAIVAILLLVTVCVSAFADARVTWNGHTYQVCMKRGTWNSANAGCKEAGGHLVTITSPEEQQFIYRQIMKHKGNVFWMGLRMASNGRWGWVTGEKLTYTNWAEGQPDGEYDAAYGTIYTTSEDWGMSPGQWDDSNNDWDEVCYICEWDFIPVESITLNKTKATLKKGDTLQLNVKKIKPADATNQRVKWTSSNQKIATVSKNGKVKAKGKGTCLIYCTAQDGSGAQASVKITVK